MTKSDSQPESRAYTGSAPHHNDSRTLKIINIAIAIVVGGIGVSVLAYVYFLPYDPDEEVTLTVREARDKLEKAQSALDKMELQEAETIANEVFNYSELKDEALLLAGESATKQGRYEDALKYYDLVGEDGDQEHVTSLWAKAEILRITYNLSMAEQQYRQAIQIVPSDSFANRGLVSVLGTSGRRWESRPFLFELIRSGDFEMQDLMLFGAIHRLINHRKFLEVATERAPRDMVSRVGLAHISYASSDADQALAYADEALQGDASLVEAHIVKGKVLLDRGFPDGFESWRRLLPETAIDHPEIWFIFGNHCESIDKREWALRCFWEAIRLDPNHQPAAYRIARLLKEMGEDEEADAYFERSSRLTSFLEIVAELSQQNVTPDELLQLATLSESLGRAWEACGWYTILASSSPENLDYERRRLELQSLLSPDLPIVAPGANTALLYPLDRFPLPTWGIETNDSSLADIVPTGDAPNFQNMASSLGLDFQYVNGDDFDEPGMQIYQEMGGAIVVLDYDGDGWQDFYFSQGGAEPMQTAADYPTDKLFRNLNGRQFVDVTAEANLGDQLYSQGASAGDLNNDGFPDLLICNVDANRVYLNQGDGTFVDITASSGVSGKRWTTSGAIADINGDGFADIYCCNYAAGSDPYTLRCDDDGVARACQPNQFDAEQDHVYFGRGDRTWSDVTATHGFIAPNGRALGVVIGDFIDSGQLDVFVANDTTENFLFVARDATGSKYDEEALLRGLSGDENGATQACMGIAVDDADEDGDLDFYVTNFFNEHNTLYRQSDVGLFDDATRRVGLLQPTIGILGFGTQFIDPERDGWMDLFVANGHVDDYRHQNRGFQMRPQFFRNTGGGRFVELEQDTLPDYFRSIYLGRSVALVDYDRDGRQDVAVMHLEQPVALLQNQTPSKGDYLHLAFVASSSARDAFGTQIRITLDNGRNFYKQLVGGSGYQASNERALSIGLGPDAKISSMTVDWPSGTSETFTEVSPNQSLLLIEGEGAPIALSHKDELP